jgi:hypothetical protein
VLSQQKRAGKLVHVQKEIDAKNWRPQPIAVIYAAGAKAPVLLARRKIATARRIARFMLMLLRSDQRHWNLLLG